VIPGRLVPLRNYEDIEVVSAVLQLVDPSAGQTEFSQAEAPLDPEVAEFLAGHVERGLGDAQAKSADFVVRGDDRVDGLCDRLLADPSLLVETSQALAELMFKVIVADERVSDGTLALLLCNATWVDGERHRFVAMLKLDASPAYRTVASTDASGRTILKLALEPGILPSVRERVQKCAFVRAGGQDVEYRLLLVDRQRGPGVVSRWFVTDFLGAEFVADAPEKTKKLYKALKAGYNEVAPDLEADELIKLDQAVTSAVSGLSVDVDEVVRGLPVGDDARERFGEVLDRRLDEREFDLDVEVAERYTRRRTFEGDFGLRLSIEADFLDEVVSVVDVGGDPPRRRIIIDTVGWKER
jgi:hypothetical protein